jgi:hypothetical protein
VRFLCLGYLDAGRFDAVPEAEKKALLAECFAQCLPFRETGKVILEEGVGHFSDTKCIRPVGGLPVVTRGSFIPSEFQLGSVRCLLSRQIPWKKRLRLRRCIRQLDWVRNMGLELRFVHFSRRY